MKSEPSSFILWPSKLVLKSVSVGVRKVIFIANVLAYVFRRFGRYIKIFVLPSIVSKLLLLLTLTQLRILCVYLSKSNNLDQLLNLTIRTSKYKQSTRIFVSNLISKLKSSTVFVQPSGNSPFWAEGRSLPKLNLLPQAAWSP